MADSHDHLGSCHCGTIQVRLRLSKMPEECALRACSCSFCRAHNTRMVADLGGEVEISAKDWSQVAAYRFGSRTADFLLCRQCGVFIAALCETSSGLRAVVNANCLAERARFTQTPADVDFEGEPTISRLARRAQTWMPAIITR